ncbi:TonB-dependent Receptor Plug Domain protein [Mariniflexile rhizosphaerae]|uniref:SusC/RagA family TonB-linked outer membrane protein n=1 Tax=unclassified Mariniflexile TaxID=2643887 RepID=UPI000CBAC40A|nr:TonB-dependent receptor [Mariniflexile sp. TRM1-10]AXP82094.1 TonB-dependent Receptor Plug Domain protein [Mariniflexile sp. TRM1-10]PLB20263.1 MAG: putative outer membrane protein involved in nutrient binding [Flavobacteriaceae bacterium FS1-H7996/R]
MKAKIILLLFFLFSVSGFAQDLTVSGVVTSSEDNMPVPGVNVIVKGTTRGVSTDFDGNYTIEVKTGEVLEFSAVGLKTVAITISNQTTVNVIMETDIASLDEVVVVGYGTQKKADLTGSITTIKSEDITRTPSGAAMQSLQGKVAGLQVVSSGAPGTAPTIRVRGIGSYTGDGASDPLYVVDGIFYDDINFLNSEDIETISILKDASASAIYGVRAANGVVLIQTKSGKANQLPQITYSGYQGVQVAQNVVKLSNSEQFSTLARESGSAAEASFIENAMQRYGRSRINPNIPNVNTDWYDLILRHATIQNHSLGITGGTSGTTYSLGLSQFEQEGILRMKNDYERFNVRSKLDVEISDRLEVGVSTLFSNATRYRPEEGAFSSAYFAVPIMPVLDPSKTDAFPKPYANAQDLGYRGPQNPFPLMDNTENRNKIRNTLLSFNLQYQVIPDKLTFKTSYSHNFETLETREVRLPYFYGIGNAFRENAELIKRNETFSEQTWDNTLTYNDDFGKHNLTLLAGSSFRDRSFEQLEAKGLNFPNGTGIGDESYFLDLAKTIDLDGVGDDGERQYFFSYFGRVAYNFDDKYLLYGTFRADGTSKYQEKWGYFPTIGAGWVISSEPFMENNGVFDFLKIRASWGELGNANVNSSTGGITSTEVDAAFGDVRYPGLVTSSDFEALKWEVTAETNVGITAKLFDNSLSVESDYFSRETRDAIIPVSRLLVPGETRQNIGRIKNSGFEIALDWNKRVSENFSYNIGANFSTLKNEILDLAGQENLTSGGDTAQRSVVGGAINSFFGLEVAGIYQTPEEIQADPAAQTAIANGLVVEPGDFRFVDHNGDTMIDAQDRVDLGSYLPSYYFGFNLGLNYKAFDFSLNVIGQGGNVIANIKRFSIRQTPDPNIDRDFAINRWNGPDTSNSYPSARGIRNPWSNQFLNSFFVEKGDFVRLQNVTLGYTLPQLKGKFDPKIRLYITAERPLTIFKYNGFTPEVADGRDNQTYPIPGVYTLGVNIKI